MHRRRALIVAYHYPPEPASGALRMGYLATYLPEHGWDTVVLTRRTSRIGRVPEGEVVRIGGKSMAESAAAAFGPQLASNRAVARLKELLRNAIFFPDRASWWIPRAIAAGLASYRRRPFDVIVSSAMPASAHIVGCALATLLHVPWIADYRDLWNGNPYVVEPPWRAKSLMQLERHVLRRAAQITTITPSLASELRALHGREIIVVPNRLDAEEWRDVPYEEPTDFRIVHAGTLYGGMRSPERLFGQIAELRSSNEQAGIGARLDFYGHDNGNLLEMASHYKLDGAVRYHGVVDRPVAMRAERSAALLVVIQNDDPRTASEYGSKIFEYHAAGRPVLALGPRESVLRGYVDEHKIGWFASTDEELRDALRAAHRAFIEGRLAEYRATNGHSARSLAETFDAIFRSTCESAA
jgi:glycosyltransferase involved in cell wall biosynthesis